MVVCTGIFWQRESRSIHWHENLRMDHYKFSNVCVHSPWLSHVQFAKRSPGGFAREAGYALWKLTSTTPLGAGHPWGPRSSITISRNARISLDEYRLQSTPRSRQYLTRDPRGSVFSLAEDICEGVFYTTRRRYDLQFHAAHVRRLQSFEGKRNDDRWARLWMLERRRAGRVSRVLFVARPSGTREE